VRAGSGLREEFFVPDQLAAPTIAPAYTFSGNRVRDVVPPPRPPVESRLPMPGSVGPPPRPAALTLAVRLWALVVVAGLVALIVSALDLAALRHELLVAARIDDRDAAEHLLADGVVVLMTTVALTCDAALLLTVWGLRLAGRRRYGAVGVMVPTALLTLVAVGVAQALVAGGATGLDRAAFLVQAGLVLPATAALLARSSRAWLRADPG
jgi:hypothetical protein